MNLKDLENKYLDTKNNAVLWAKNKPCRPLYQEDILILGEIYEMNFPKCFNKFERSNEVNHVCALSAHKTIMKALDRLRLKILT